MTVPIPKIMNIDKKFSLVKFDFFELEFLFSSSACASRAGAWPRDNEKHLENMKNKLFLMKASIAFAKAFRISLYKVYRDYCLTHWQPQNLLA